MLRGKENGKHDYHILKLHNNSVEEEKYSKQFFFHPSLQEQHNNYTFQSITKDKGTTFGNSTI